MKFLIKLKFLQYLFFAIVIFYTVKSYGQNITWQRILSNDYGGLVNVENTNDGYIFCGNIRVNNSYKICITKTDYLGNTIWVKVFGTGNTTARSMEKSNNNGFIIAGYTDSLTSNICIYILRIDENGNLLWQKYFSYSGLDQANCIKKTNDNGYIIAGRTTYQPYDCIIMLKIDSLGILQWNKIYDYNKRTVIKDILVTDNSYLLTGWIENNTTDILIIKINNFGDTIWTKQYGYSFTDAAYSADYCGQNNYIITGETTNNINHTESYLIKIDSAGNKLWDRSYFGKFSEVANRVKCIQNRYIILCGSMDTTNISHTRAFIKLLDTSGIVLKQITFTPLSRGGLFNDLKLTADGNYICAGTANDNSFLRMYAAKVDSLLFANPIGIIRNNNAFKQNILISQNYPNPFNPTTNIRYEIPRNAEVTIKIYDLLGKEVFNLNEYKQAGSYEVKFDGSNLASGMYFYSIKAETSQRDVFTDVKKMILLK